MKPETLPTTSATNTLTAVTGTRVLVTTILDNLAAGMQVEDIVKSYPSITRQSVQAAVGYAADLAKERVLSLSR